LQSLGQVSASQTAEIFRDFLRGHVREMICEVMAAEVTELCGLKHSPSTSDHYRAGSCPVRVLVEGEREEVVRPRVHRKGEDGSNCEVELATHRLAKDPGQLQAQVIQAIVMGVSGRSMQGLKPKSPGVSRSSVSRLWESAGGKFVETLRGKALSAVTWCSLMLDGIRLSSDQTAVVALGSITRATSGCWTLCLAAVKTRRYHGS
jgi:transposase-like protein